MTVATQKAESTTSTDRIEKSIELSAPRSRVWRAITTAKEFGTWFGMNLDREFAEGAKLVGRVTKSGWEHVPPVEMLVERMKPETYFSYRWHPYALDPKVDYSAEPTTLVEFTLEEREGGTALTIVESGFDRLPAARRAEAYRMNEGGWGGQLKNIAKYVA